MKICNKEKIEENHRTFVSEFTLKKSAKALEL